jgi:hypothetical protein
MPPPIDPGDHDVDPVAAASPAYPGDVLEPWRAAELVAAAGWAAVAVPAPPATPERQIQTDERGRRLYALTLAYGVH